MSFWVQFSYHSIAAATRLENTPFDGAPCRSQRDTCIHPNSIIKAVQ